MSARVGPDRRESRAGMLISPALVSRWTSDSTSNIHRHRHIAFRDSHYPCPFHFSQGRKARAALEIRTTKQRYSVIIYWLPHKKLKCRSAGRWKTPRYLNAAHAPVAAALNSLLVTMGIPGPTSLLTSDHDLPDIRSCKHRMPSLYGTDPYGCIDTSLTHIASRLWIDVHPSCGRVSSD